MKQNQPIRIKIFNQALEKRLLTALGKITVVKTFLLSKLNDMFLSLPDISYLKDLNEMFF